jgi:plastocyanin
MVSRATFEALAFGTVLIVIISGSVVGFNAVAESGPLLDEGGTGVTDEAAATDHQGADSETGAHHDDAGGEGGHHGGDKRTDAEDGQGDGEQHDGGGMDHDDGMSGDMAMQMRTTGNGTVINNNVDMVPPGCDAVAGERSLTVHGGVEYAAGGEMFSFERDLLELEACTRVTVTFVNEDEIRHQWMLHGLPKDVYPMGMFNVEVDGPGAATGTFITPGQDVTLNTHCSLPQHEQKGMQMTVVVGEGGDGMNH